MAWGSGSNDGKTYVSGFWHVEVVGELANVSFAEVPVPTKDGGDRAGLDWPVENVGL